MLLSVPKEDKQKGIRLFLDGEEKMTHLRFDGKFSFFNLTTGTHILVVDSPTQHFHEIRIDVNRHGKMRALLNDDSLTQISIPLKLSPLEGEKKFFEERKSFDPTSLLYNPMVIMFLLGGLMMVLPKLVDQDALKEVQDTMNQGEGSVREYFKPKEE
eukprot:gene11953-5354_t